MKPMTDNRRIGLMSLLGAAIGSLILHPYTMVFYELHDGNGSGYRRIVRLLSE